MEQEPQSNNSEQKEGKSYLSFLKNKSWEDWAFLFLLLVILIFYFSYISGYKQLPSPVYGGDLYRDRGFIKNIASGNPAWSDAFYADEIQYYPYLIFAIEGYFVRLTGADIDKTFLFFPLITLILASIIWYKLGILLFKSKKWGLMTAAAFMLLVYNPAPKCANVAIFLFMPAFFYFWFRYELENHKKDAIFAGVFLGLISLTWGGMFLSLFATFAMIALFYYVSDSIKNKNFFQNFIIYLKKYYLIALIAILISMIFFIPLIIKYQMHEVNEVTKWGDTKIELLGPSWVFSALKGMFFDFNNTFKAIISLICLAGLVGLVLTIKSKESKFILLILISNILVIQHHLITRPLLGTSLLPEKLIFFQWLLPLFFIFGAKVISGQLKKTALKSVFLFILIILLIGSNYYWYNDYRNSRWESHGFSTENGPSALYSLADWMEKNVKPSEITLSHDEAGFMLAALSGRKVMLTRRTHASYYIDIDKRIAEAAVAMYGNNLTLSKEILNKYNIKFFYLDFQLLGQAMRVRPEFKEFLLKNKVNFTEARDRYDVAVPQDRANLRDLLIIPPQKINPKFSDLWEKVYVVQEGNQVAGELYKLKE